MNRCKKSLHLKLYSSFPVYPGFWRLVSPHVARSVTQRKNTGLVPLSNPPPPPPERTKLAAPLDPLTPHILQWARRRTLTSNVSYTTTAVASRGYSGRWRGKNQVNHPELILTLVRTDTSTLSKNKHPRVSHPNISFTLFENFYLDSLLLLLRSTGSHSQGK